MADEPQPTVSTEEEDVPPVKLPVYRNDPQTMRRILDALRDLDAA